MPNIEFFTGFEGCGVTSDVYALLDSISGVSYSATGGWDNGKCLKITSNNGFAQKNVSAAKTKVVGFHARNLTQYVYNDTNRYLVKFNGPNISIWNTPAGLDIRRDTTQIDTDPYIFSSSLCHVEIKCFSDAVSGTLTIKVDGVTIYSESGLNTGGTDITSILLGSTNNISNCYDNIFIADDWCGELKSQLCKPSSDDAIQFSKSGGSFNYEMVDDTAQDGDATYVYSGTVGHEDLYGFEDIPEGQAPVAVTLVVVARKDDVEARTLQLRAEQDASGYDIGSAITLAVAYPSAVLTGQFRVLAVAPDSSAWTRTIFNAIKWGFKVAS